MHQLARQLLVLDLEAQQHLKQAHWPVLTAEPLLRDQVEGPGDGHPIELIVQAMIVGRIGVSSRAMMTRRIGSMIMAMTATLLVALLVAPNGQQQHRFRLVLI